MLSKTRSYKQDTIPDRDNLPKNVLKVLYNQNLIATKTARGEKNPYNTFVTGAKSVKSKIMNECQRQEVHRTAVDSATKNKPRLIFN